MNANKGKENKNLQDGQRNRKRTRNDRRKAKEAAKTAAAAAAAAAAAVAAASAINKSENNKIAAARASWTSSACTTNAKNVKNAAINIYNAHQPTTNGGGVGVAKDSKGSDGGADDQVNGPSISGQQHQQQKEEEEEQQEKRQHEEEQQCRLAILNSEPAHTDDLNAPQTFQLMQFGKQWEETQALAATHISTTDITSSSSQCTWTTSPWQVPDISTQQQQQGKAKSGWPMRPQNHYLEASTQMMESELDAKTLESLQPQPQSQRPITTTITTTTAATTTTTTTTTIGAPNGDELSHIQSAQLPLIYAQSPLDLNATDWLSDFRKLLPLPNSMLHCSQIESDIFAQMANLARSFTPLGMQFSLPQFGGSQCNPTVPGTSFAMQFDAQLGSTTPPASSSPPPQEQFGTQFGSRFGENIPWDLVLQTMPRDLIDEMPSKLLLEMQLPRSPLCDNFVAMDCEMVGIGVDGQTNMVARVSIVNQRGQVLLDKYVKPREFITDYRTAVSGIRPNDFLNADDFCAVQSWVQQILHNRILVGHNVATDLKVLNMFHPFSKIRDTSHYKPLAHYVSNGRTPSLKLLSHVVLGVEIQNGEHDSVEDARAAMGVYNRVAEYWEGSLKRIYACTI